MVIRDHSVGNALHIYMLSLEQLSETDAQNRKQESLGLNMRPIRCTYLS